MVIKDTQSGVCQETHEYYCYFCKNWSDKNLWGPGRIWCPNCKERALSPAEKMTIQEKWEKVLFADLQKMDMLND